MSVLEIMEGWAIVLLILAVHGVGLLAALRFHCFFEDSSMATTDACAVAGSGGSRHSQAPVEEIADLRE